MPSGKTHQIASLTGAVAVPAAMYLYGFPTSETVGVAMGFLISLKLNPDLDLNRKINKHRPSEWLFWLLWWPYSRLISHRSIWSHFPIIGTALRLVYIVPILLLFVRGLGIEINGSRESLLYLLGGLTLSDIIHFAMDVVSTRLKRMK